MRDRRNWLLALRVRSGACFGGLRGDGNLREAHAPGEQGQDERRHVRSSMGCSPINKTSGIIHSKFVLEKWKRRHQRDDVPLTVPSPAVNLDHPVPTRESGPDHPAHEALYRFYRRAGSNLKSRTSHAASFGNFSLIKLKNPPTRILTVRGLRRGQIVSVEQRVWWSDAGVSPFLLQGRPQACLFPLAVRGALRTK